MNQWIDFYQLQEDANKLGHAVCFEKNDRGFIWYKILMKSAVEIELFPIKGAWVANYREKVDYSIKPKAPMVTESTGSPDVMKNQEKIDTLIEENI